MSSFYGTYYWGAEELESAAVALLVAAAATILLGVSGKGAEVPFNSLLPTFLMQIWCKRSMC